MPSLKADEDLPAVTKGGGLVALIAGVQQGPYSSLEVRGDSPLSKKFVAVHTFFFF